MIYVASVPGRSEWKIGFTRAPRQRLVDLRRTLKARVRFIALVDGSLNDERLTHEALADFEVERVGSIGCCACSWPTRSEER